MKKPNKKVGRPKSANPLSFTIRFRVAGQVHSAIAMYQEKYHLNDQSEAARKALIETLRREGML